MKVITWNVNSIRLRSSLIYRLLEIEKPDILCLQECKSLTEQMSLDLFESIWYLLSASWCQKIYSGEILAYVGNEKENGGWPPHVHFQLSLIKPEECNLPGVVSDEHHNLALKVFPDPRLVLGKIYWMVRFEYTPD